MGQQNDLCIGGIVIKKKNVTNNLYSFIEYEHGRKVKNALICT